MGLREPESVKNSVRTYEQKSDRVGLFVDEMCVIDKDSKVSRSELYSAYKSWCRANGVNAKSAQKFYEAMEKHAPQKIIHGVRLFDGLKLANVSNVIIK